MENYTVDDVIICLNSSSDLLIAANLLYQNKNIRHLYPALVELSLEEMGKAIYVYSRTELGKDLRKELNFDRFPENEVFGSHDLKIDIFKDFLKYSLLKVENFDTPFNNNTVKKQISDSLKLNNNKKHKFEIEYNRKINLQNTNPKELLEIIDKSFQKYFIGKDDFVIKN